MPAKIRLDRMLACAYPPRSEPITAVANRTMRSVMRAALITLPMKMNSGAATNGNEFIVCDIFCGTMVGDSPDSITKASDANPMATNSGTPVRMPSSHTAPISNIRLVIRRRPQRPGRQPASRRHTASAAACNAISNAAGINGMYNHTIETGSDVA